MPVKAGLDLPMFSMGEKTKTGIFFFR